LVSFIFLSSRVNLTLWHWRPRVAAGSSYTLEKARFRVTPDHAYVSLL